MAESAPDFSDQCGAADEARRLYRNAMRTNRIEFVQSRKVDPQNWTA
jgi:hypothetical protein